MVNKILVIVFIFFCFELGFFLLIFPWSRFWEENIFLFYLPAVRDVLLNHFFRGAVSGLGLVDIALGVWEAMHFKVAVAYLNHE